MASQSNNQLIRKILSEFEQNIAQLILLAISEQPFQLGIKRTIDFLKGNNTPFAINHELNKLQTFSALTGFTRDQLSDIIDILIRQGFIYIDKPGIDEDEYPVLSITPKALNYLNGEPASKLSLLDIIMDKDVPGISEEDQDLFNKLKQVRRQLAEDQDIPSFDVCADSVLHSFCTQKPMENEDMEKINGVDDAFMEFYSKQFLYVIRQYVTREKNI